MRTDEKLRIALHVPHALRRDFGFSGTQVFTYGFVTVNERQQVRNPSESYEDQRPFYSLSFRAQASPDMCEGQPYAYSLEYREVGSVGLREAEAMLKTLRKIAKADATFPVRPATFGQFVALHCQALGVKMAVQDMTDGRGHDETEHNYWKANEIQWLVDHQINEFLESNKAAMKDTAEAMRR